jgi:asparagine N-glycosylation enzyme membrane subunit Stt3
MAENNQIKRGPYPRVTGGLILILLGVLFLLTEMGRISWADWWAYFLVGLGGIFILEAVFRGFSEEGRKNISGRLIAAAVLIIVGGAHLIGFIEWWPLILIAVGAIILVSSFAKK